MKQLRQIFGSYMKAQEIVLLLNGKKSVVRQGFYQEELPTVKRYCQEKRIILVQSPFKVLLADPETGLFSNKGIRVAENDKRPGMYFVYLSFNQEQAWLAAYYETMQDHRGLGKVLGYPACCVDFFCHSFHSGRTNLVLPATNPWTNLTKREEDAVLLSHFPCSSECSESVQLAREYFNELKNVNANYTQKLFEKLNS